MTTAIAGLVQIDLPSGTIRWAEGGRIKWGANTFAARDDTYGSVLSLGSIRESHGDTLEPLELGIAPKDYAAVAVLTSPAVQGSVVRFWLAQYIVATGVVTGTPALRFNGVIDEAVFDLNGDLTLTVIPGPAMFIERDIGNTLSAAFHKSNFPLETGHDQATGLAKAIAWGAERPNSRAASGGVTDYDYFQYG